MAKGNGMTRYLMRLDDASEYMDIARWEQVERLLDCYQIRPIVGIIPDSQDPALVGKYERDDSFWKKAESWIAKGWMPALHGCEHKYITREGGLNPVNAISEFAGLPYETQAEKIERGWNILNGHGIVPKMFFAPAHTFDKNTLKAISNTTNIRIINDTIACDVYKDGAFWFIPQQSGRAREVSWPWRLVTFCYHPNTMQEKDYKVLEKFLQKNSGRFTEWKDTLLKNREFGMMDWVLRKAIFAWRRIRRRTEG